MKRALRFSLALAVVLYAGVAAAEPCVDSMDCADDAQCVDGVCVDAAPVPECVTDTDCPQDGPCLDGVCQNDGPVAECYQDDECAQGQVCFKYTCMVPEDGFCTADVHCGAGTICVWNSCESEQGYCAQDSECGVYGRCAMECVLWGRGEDGNYDTCTSQRGTCQLDMSKVPTQPECQEYCEFSAQCDGGSTDEDVVIDDGEESDGGTIPQSGSGGDSSPDEFKGDNMARAAVDPVAFCVAECSAMVADEDSKQAALDVLECLKGSGTCPTQAEVEACIPYLQALTEIVANDPDLRDVVPMAVGSGTLVQDDTTAGGETKNNDNDGTFGAADSNSTGCALSGGLASPTSLLVLVLLAIAFMGIRRK